MTTFGYTLSSEERRPNDLVRAAQRAEEVGFEFVSISDHFHPWIGAQGQSPFVWSTIGGVAATTERIRVGVGVCCPIIRIHPAIVAQAAATSAAMLDGRFFLGVGTGELLNEHVTGQRWPPLDVRRQMLAEAVDVIRRLWSGETINFHGQFYDVDNARIYTMPEVPPAVVVSAFGPKAVDLAAEIGDGLWSSVPDPQLTQRYHDAGGDGPRIAQVELCWGENRDDAVRVAHRVWPNSSLPGSLGQELSTPSSFEAAVGLVSEEMVANTVPCGPDPEPVVKAVRMFEEAGFDHLHFHQIGPEEDGFFRFWEKELEPALLG